MEDDRKRKRKDGVRRADDDYDRERKSKKPRSRSRSPKANRDRTSRRRKYSKSPENNVKHEKQDVAPQKDAHGKNEAPERKNKETDMLNTRTGGAYIPPARLRMMQAQITDKSSVPYQRLAWEALKKSIHGHINKINVGNIGIIIKELLKENIVRGRGLLCRSVIQAQAASPTFTNVYAALVAAVNSRFPNIGELLLKRLVIQFKRGFKRNDKAICISSASFIAHLVNQRVAHEILALELLTLLVETPTDDSVEVSIAFLKECGQKLTEVSSKGVNAIFEMLRNILHEGQLDKRVQYMIEVMFQVWKDGFKDHPSVIEELELVPEEEQFTHLMMLDEATDPQDILNVFKFDDKYEENEQKYKNLSKEILGSDAESGEEGSGESGSEESDEDDEESEQKPMMIIDNTETNLVALRRTIYLTINSSLDFEECAHKLMKMQLKPGQEVELCHMFLDCCAEQRTYEKFYGLLAQRFCNINRMYIGPFEEIFKDSYSTAHRLDTNRLRNVSKFFAHLFFTDSISWEVLECVKLNEEDTTSSSRIYIKILFQELAEYMGLKKLNDRLKDPTLQAAFAGIFPRDNPKNTRFSINFFTSIGLGGLTDELREHLKQMPKNVPPPVTEITVESSSESSSSSSASSSSDDSSDSSSNESEKEDINKKKKKNKKSKDNEKEIPENTDDSNKAERWGHDGFYDTYGKDARRHESDRDRDNFVKPKDVPKRNGDDGDRYRERNRYWEDSRRYEGRSDRDRHFDNRHDSEDNRINEGKDRDGENRDKQRRDMESDRRDRDQRNERDVSRRNKDHKNEREHESRSSRNLEKEDEENYRKNKYQRYEKDDKKSREPRTEKDDNNKKHKEYDSKTGKADRNEREYIRKDKYQRNEREESSSDKRDQRKETEDYTRSGRDKRIDKNDRDNNDYTSKKNDDKLNKQRASDKEDSNRSRSGRDSVESIERYQSESKGKDDRRNKKKEESSKNKYDSGYESKKRDKENKNEVEDRTKSKKNKDKASESDESNEDERKRNKQKESKKDRKEKHKDKKSSENVDSDDWDIKRASSVRVEPTGRYWDNYNSDKLNEFELSDKEGKSSNRKKR